MRGSDWKKRKEDTNSQCQSHTVNVHNSPTHLSSSSSSSSVSPYAEFCDHSTWRRKNKSHRSVEGRSRFGVEARMNIKIRGRASILHGCTSNLQTSTRSLTCPGRKREENSGIRGAFSCKSDQRGPLFSAARLCATDIATNFSLRPKLLYTPRGWFTTFRPLVIHRPTMEPGTDRGRRFRGEIAFHAVRSSSILFEADPPRRGFGLEFEPLPLEIPEKALSAELEVVEFSGPVITGKNVLSRKKTSSDYVLGIGSVWG